MRHEASSEEAIQSGNIIDIHVCPIILVLPLVMVSPADSVLISGGSDERRRFMDVVISQYDKEYLDALIRYNKALAQRNTLLKSEMPVEEELFSGMGGDDGSGR